MSAWPAPAMLDGGFALLERAVAYTLGSLQRVTPAAMTRSTPCRAWDLRALLGHMNDSLVALQEAADLGHVDLAPPCADHPADPVSALRERACRLLGAWAQVDRPGGDDDQVSVAGCPLALGLVSRAGALEVAVHGWDVARACGLDRPIPPALADHLLGLVPLLVTDRDRPGRFASPVGSSPSASANDRLLAALGRTPA